MRIVLTLAALALSASAAAEPSAKPSAFALLCRHSGEHSSGLNKTCYYQCGGVESGGITEPIYDACPYLVARWSLNRNSQFGPRVDSR